MLRNSSVLHLQWRENFLNACPVIYISDSSMLMQETVISFEEVMQTKLKIKLFISRFSTQSWQLSIWQSRLAFQAKYFFSNSWFVVDLVFFVGYLKCFAFGYMIERISSAIMLEFLLCKNRESIFSLTLSDSAQVITKNDLQQILIFLDTKQNLTIKISWETATFPVKSVSALSHAFGSRTLIVHTTEFTRWDANCYFFIYSRCYAPAF